MSGGGITVGRAAAAVAGRQAAWIAAMEPWRGLGYGAVGLGRYLRRSAAAGQVWIARLGLAGTAAAPAGVLVLQPGVLLGSFVALLAVRAEAGRRGVGRALLAHAESRTAGKRQWLFVSADQGNRTARAFYRKLGFAVVGRLPDLVRAGRTEILLRKRVQ